MRVVLLAACAVALALAEDAPYALGDVDLSEVLGNDRLLTAYSKCLVNEGPCTPEVKKLKEKLPELLETRCAKCTEKQREMGKSLTKELKAKHPEIWSKLVSFYDPQGKYQKSFEEFLNS